MKKNDLKAWKDSVGFYYVEDKNKQIVWEGWAKNANEAKENAIDCHEHELEDRIEW